MTAIVSFEELPCYRSFYLKVSTFDYERTVHSDLLWSECEDIVSDLLEHLVRMDVKKAIFVTGKFKECTEEEIDLFRETFIKLSKTKMIYKPVKCDIALE